jgi:hypothetical protein
MSLARNLAAEQWAFLRRGRGGWGEHLHRVRSFLAAGFQAADPARATLVAGAGSGLEVPWALAPPGTVGWDADPWSRILTFLRHRRWAPWVFQDLTGGTGPLEDLVRRCLRRPGSGERRVGARTRLRLAGLVDGLRPDAAPLEAWIRARRPGSILVANVMGQFGPLAQRILERAFRPASPWEPDPDRPDPLARAVDAWTLRALERFLEVLGESGADLWLVHDRGVVFGAPGLSLGPMAEPWTAQLRSPESLDVSDPLCGLDVPSRFPGRRLEHHERWLWPVGPGQTHVMEALRVAPG